MLPTNSMTAYVVYWLFSGVSVLHLVAMALVWAAVFIPGKLGFKNDKMLQFCAVVYLICELAVMLLGVSSSLGLILTVIGGAAFFFGIGRLIRWLVMKLRKA